MAAPGLGVDIRVVARVGARVTLAVTVSLIVLVVMATELFRLMGMPSRADWRDQPNVPKS